MPTPTPLTPDQLLRRCDPERFSFETTDELSILKDVIGQPRAVQAIRFGIGIAQQGYNLFALGAPGVGKFSVVHRFLTKQATRQPVPPDLCYVHNFDEPSRPKALALPPGRGAPFKRAMEALGEVLRTAVPAAFESDDYRARRKVLEERFKTCGQDAFAGIEKEAREKSIAIVRTPGGLALAPIKDDAIVEPEAFQKLPEAEQQRWRADMDRLQEKLETALREGQRIEHEAREKLKELNRAVADFAAGHAIAELRAKSADLPAVQAYL
ncbi:MAG: Lon-like protease helical domain-containing protein, partial [Acetobacteraceae bacterium]